MSTRFWIPPNGLKVGEAPQMGGLTILDNPHMFILCLSSVYVPENHVLFRVWPHFTSEDQSQFKALGHGNGASASTFMLSSRLFR